RKPRLPSRTQGKEKQPGGCAMNQIFTLPDRISRPAYASVRTESSAPDDFLAMLAHELRSPLHSILGWVQLMQRDSSDDLKRNALKAMERNVRAMSQIVDDILDRSRIVTGKLRLTVEPVDLGALVREAVSVIRPLADARGIEVYARAPAELPVIQGDPG